eukprot:TRINITY_DN32591_c0_g1_i2.p1 TRINITY_DN32591_c0_g1~~TRINITY_DN32591_c0_g1_i2.p1  ORF type:complete len:463 (+),score=65.24 TRINITY_DN32591_c0_g1_i2:60-1391(+)
MDGAREYLEEIRQRQQDDCLTLKCICPCEDEGSPDGKSSSFDERSEVSAEVKIAARQWLRSKDGSSQESRSVRPGYLTPVHGAAAASSFVSRPPEERGRSATPVLRPRYSRSPLGLQPRELERTPIRAVSPRVSSDAKPVAAYKMPGRNTGASTRLPAAATASSRSVTPVRSGIQERDQPKQAAAGRPGTSSAAKPAVAAAPVQTAPGAKTLPASSYLARRTASAWTPLRSSGVLGPCTMSSRTISKVGVTTRISRVHRSPEASLSSVRQPRISSRVVSVRTTRSSSPVVVTRRVSRAPAVVIPDKSEESSLSQQDVSVRSDEIRPSVVAAVLRTGSTEVPLWCRGARFSVAAPSIPAPTSPVPSGRPVLPAPVLMKPWEYLAARDETSGVILSSGSSTPYCPASFIGSSVAVEAPTEPVVRKASKIPATAAPHQRTASYGGA